MHSLYRAVLFDFDGTLADSYAAITMSVNFVLAQHSRPPLTETKVKSLVGSGLLQLMADILPGADPIANARIYQEHHPTVMYEHTHLLPGVQAALADLHASNVAMAVCSNKPVAITRKLVSSLQMAPYVNLDAVFGPEDSGNPKPDPGMVHCALNRLGVDTNSSLYVGDMPVDVLTARNAGLTVWVLPTGSSDLESLQRARPDRILKNMSELAPAILFSH